ncbi:hypothetical protein Y032_0246g17 [Ancylostoma ceylanicum]|uniref:Uncharacterized protein n=1 Tax=Ancylostoma ceylanicum TaxID=53326 RepID=A0A016SDT9_9BILA|nr:hypothetical protein Y032_0246g17 [Ancylostoma ceylanicum]
MITSTTSSHPLSEVSQSGDSVTTASDHQGGVMGLVLLTLLLRPSFTNVRFAGNDAIIYETADHSVMRLSLDNMETETLFDRSSIRSWASTTFLKNCASQYIPTGMCNLYKLLLVSSFLEQAFS